MATERRNELKNQLANKAQTQVDAPKKSPQALVGDYLAKNMKAMASVLPEHMNAERMARISLNVIRNNPLLLQCALPSLMGAVMESAKLGLEPGLMGQSYILPYKNYKASKAAGQDVYEAQFIIGYRGLIDLVRRSGQVSVLRAVAIHEKDEYEIDEGIDANIVHKPNLTEERGAPIIYYAVAKMKDGSHSFAYMTKSEIEKHRDKYSKAKEFGPWKDEFDAMAKKTVLRQLIKYLPISVEFLSNDEAAGVKMHNEVVDDANIIDIDYETGEILNPEPIQGAGE